MKTRNILWLIASFVVLLSSCSKPSGLFETIPADMFMVINVNGRQLAKDLKTGNDSTPVAQNMDELVKMLTDASAVVDVENLVMTMDEKQNIIVTFTVTDRQGFVQILEKRGTLRKDTGGYEVFADNGVNIALGENQAWVSEKQAAPMVEHIKKMLSGASKKPLSANSAVMDALAKRNCLFTFAVNPVKVGMPTVPEGRVCVGQFEIKDNRIRGKAWNIEADGSVADYKDLERINTPVLQYAPENATMVSAFGVKKDFDWDAMFGAIAKSVPNPALIAQLDMFKPFFKAIDGTVMLAVAPAAAGEGPGQLPVDFILMAHMSQEKVNESVALATSLVSQTGMVTRQEEVGEGLYKLYLGEIGFYVGNVDGYFTISSTKPAPVNGSSIAGRFTGKYAGFSLKLDPSMLPRHDYGFDIIAFGDTKECEITVSLLGSDMPILSSIFNL